MWEGIFGDLAGLGIEAAQGVLLVRGVPDHVVSIDAEGVGARLGAGQLKLLEGLRCGIEAAELAAASLAEPDNAVGIDLEALWFAFRRRIEFGHLPILRNADDGG